MPDIFLYVNEVRKVQLEAMMSELGPALRKATADSLPDLGGPEDVEVRVIGTVASDNATTVQILCVASASDERLSHKALLALNLAKAWRKVAQKHCVGWIDDVGVWPIMPEGAWFAATLEAIRELEESLKK